MQLKILVLLIEEIIKGIQVNNVMMQRKYQVTDVLQHVKLKASIIDQVALTIFLIPVLLELLKLLLI